MTAVDSLLGQLLLIICSFALARQGFSIANYNITFPLCQVYQAKIKQITVINNHPQFHSVSFMI